MLVTYTPFCSFSYTQLPTGEWVPPGACTWSPSTASTDYIPVDGRCDGRIRNDYVRRIVGRGSEGLLPVPSSFYVGVVPNTETSWEYVLLPEVASETVWRVAPGPVSSSCSAYRITPRYTSYTLQTSKLVYSTGEEAETRPCVANTGCTVPFPNECGFFFFLL
jgi:hypothetical protein